MKYRNVWAVTIKGKTGRVEVVFSTLEHAIAFIDSALGEAEEIYAEIRRRYERVT